MMTRPKRDSIGPSRMKLERIFMAASSGTNGQSASWAVIASVSAVGRRDLEADVAHDLAHDLHVADPGTLREA